MATDRGVEARAPSVESLGGEGLRMRLGSGPEAAADARRAISRLRADLDPPLMETLRLLMTELITNCVRHTASDSLTLRVAVGKSAVLTEVADTGPGLDEECVERSASDDTGWGLFLLRRLASKWGVAHDGPSTRVWFELKRA